MYAKQIIFKYLNIMTFISQLLWRNVELKSKRMSGRLDKLQTSFLKIVMTRERIYM